VPPKSTKGPALKREAPMALIIAAGIVLLLAIGAGAFYAFNGGWKTAGQQAEDYKHEFQPIMAAKHGDTTALDAENKARTARGQAPLEMPKDRKELQGDYRQKLQALREKLGGPRGQSTNP